TDVRFRNATAKLQTGTPGIGLHFRSFLQNGFDLAQKPIGLRERSAWRRNVIENETALVHDRHEARAHILERDDAQQHKRHETDNYEPRLFKKTLHVVPVHFVHAAREPSGFLDLSVSSF